MKTYPILLVALAGLLGTGCDPTPEILEFELSPNPVSAGGTTQIKLTIEDPNGFEDFELKLDVVGPGGTSSGDLPEPSGGWPEEGGELSYTTDPLGIPAQAAGSTLTFEITPTDGDGNEGETASEDLVIQ